MARGKLKIFVALSLLTLATQLTAAQPALTAETSKSKQNSESVPAKPASKTAGWDHDYVLWGKQLSRFVADGNVHYKDWQKHQEGLIAFLKSADRLPAEEYNSFSREERIAFWINLYNALCIKTVLDNYPIHGKVAQYPADSFRQIANDWEAEKFNVMGTSITAYTIEHEKLRKDAKEPRIQFAVCCASRSCGRIQTQPYLPGTLETQLEEATVRFLRDKKNVRICTTPDKESFMVSKIFSWFTLDFARRAGFSKMQFPPPSDEEIIASYIRPYLIDSDKSNLDLVMKKRLEDPERFQVKFDYLPYDWSLNDADKLAEAEKSAQVDTTKKETATEIK